MKATIFLTFLSVLAVISSDRFKQNRVPASSSNSKVSSKFISEHVDSISKLTVIATKYNLVQSEYQGVLSKRYAENFETNDHIEEDIIVDGDSVKPITLLRPVSEKFYGKEVLFKALEVNGKSHGFASLINNKDVSTPVPIDGENEIVFMVDYNDSSAPSADGDRPILERHTLANHLNTKYFKNYVDDVFRGRRKTTITKVVGWHRVQRNCTDTHYPNRPGNTGYMDNDDMRQLFYDNNIDHTKYDHVSILVSCLQWHSWGDATLSKTLEFPDGHKISFSKSYVGSRRMYYGVASDPTPYLPPNKNFMRVFLHERIHAFGFFHSAGMDCGLSEEQFPCESQSYGNPYDTMGTGYQVASLNADLLRRHDIRDETQYLTIDSPGVYEISPLLSKNPTDKIGIYIKSEFSNDPVYMVENRTALSVDRYLMLPEFKQVRDGLALYSSVQNSKLPLKVRGDIYDHPQTKSPKFGSQLKFIDAKPSSHANLSENFIERSKYDAITRTNNFFDPITGIRIKVLRPSFSQSKNQKIKFQVDYLESKRVCYKGELKNQVGSLYIKKIKSKPSVSESKKTIVYPWDEFTLSVISKRPNPLYCPRDRIEVEVLNPEVLEEFVEPRDPNGGGIGTGFDGKASSRGDGGPVIGGDGGENLSIKKNFDDYKRMINVSRTLKTPSLART
jgi:hypothetical protein